MRTDSPRAHDPDGAKHGVGVLGKALDIIEEAVWREPKTLGELAAATGIEKAAVYRILNTLCVRGYLSKEDVSRTYRPGPRLLAAADLLARSDGIVTVARPYLEALRDEVGETVNLGTLIGNEVQYLEIVESRHSLRMSATVGSRDPAHSTALGKAMLSRLDVDTLATIYPGNGLRSNTEKTLSTIAKLHKTLDRVRSAGFAVDNEENEVGAVCIAAPIRGAGETLYAVSISGPSARLKKAALTRLGKRLAKVSAEVAGD